MAQGRLVEHPRLRVMARWAVPFVVVAAAVGLGTSLWSSGAPDRTSSVASAGSNVATWRHAVAEDRALIRAIRGGHHPPGTSTVKALEQARQRLATDRTGLRAARRALRQGGSR